MITIVYSTHRDNDYNKKFENHLLKTVGLPKVQILQYINKKEYSLSQLYNRGINESNFDIVVCLHNDVKLENNWGKKIIQDFKENSEFAIIGKAGTCYFPSSGIFWEKMSTTMVGQVYHEPKGKKKWLSKYSDKYPFIIPVVSIDGLFISFDKTKIKHRFDESIGGFHYYDHSFCLPNFLDGVKIGVTTSFEITHESIGMTNQEFHDTKEIFLKKYKEHLPIDLKPTNIPIPNIKEKPIKNIGKVAIIIPTKNNNDLLFDCIESFYENCNKNLFHMFIADTGSDQDILEKTKEYISKYDNITLVNYDYYNFAKINNDVVKNHISDDFEFLLFCNNDIKIMNNVIYIMLKNFKNNINLGTLGSRLHFKDCTIQHNGILCFLDQKNEIHLSHESLKKYYGNYSSVKEVIGNTGALMMMRKKVFQKCGYFNENYLDCFEDVELNMNCILNGYINLCDSSACAFHYESQTRNLNAEKIRLVNEDFKNRLEPFIKTNLDKLFKYLKVRV